MNLLLAVLAAARVVTLQQAVDSARANQPQLRQARAGSQAAAARAQQAFAPMLPQVSARAGFQHSAGTVTVRSASCSTDPTAPCPTGVASGNTWSDSLTASLLLFDFFSTPNRWEAAKAQADAQAATERATELSVDFTVRSAYFDARADKALVQVAADTLANQQKHLQQTEGFVKAGTHPEIDLAQARTDTANARVALINSQNTYETAKVTLNSAMGILGTTDYDVADEAMPAVQNEDADTQPLYDEAVKDRPEFASIEALVHADELTVRSLQGQYWPSISGSAGVAQSGTSLSDLGWNATVGVVATWQIFQGGSTRAQVAEAQANVGSEVAQLDLLKQTLRSDVDSARLAVRGAKESISAAQEALTNAKVRLTLAEQRYQVGVGSAIELGDAQVAVTQAAAQLVQADDTLSKARAQLLRALGRR
ncbi:MAG: TolC family protein [Myxococcales bacterium]